MKVRFADAAKFDLEEISVWLASNAGDIAFKVMLGLRRSCLSLGDMPARFPLVPGHEGSGVRRRVHGTYLIYYSITADFVLVLRILHGARDVDRIMFPTT